jgi:2-dehydropantoate 2-reductase
MPENHPYQRIVIAGAGAIGNYLGVQLHQAGFAVTFLGSTRMVHTVEQQGLLMEYPDDQSDNFLPKQLMFTDDTHCCADADIIIVTVKSLVTEILIQQVRPHLRSATTLLTLQNGISNAAILKAAFPDNRVLGGMVTFNVIEKSAAANVPATFRLTTHGEIYLEKSLPSLLPVFQQSNCAAKELDNIDAMLWSKLLLNLINPLNALSGHSLKQNLEDRQFRLQWVQCMREGLDVLKAAGIKPAKVTPLPPQFLPFMVSLPNWIYLFLAKNMTDMDPTAKSSMAQDMEKGKPTEIDFLSGELIRLGKKVGVPTPENDKVYRAIKNLEQALR